MAEVKLHIDTFEAVHLAYNFEPNQLRTYVQNAGAYQYSKDLLSIR